MTGVQTCALPILPACTDCWVVCLQVPPAWGGMAQAGLPGASVPGYGQGGPQGPVDMESRVPVINLKDGTRLAGDDAPTRKDLEQWLREHPGFVADTGAFIPVSPPPSQPHPPPSASSPPSDSPSHLSGLIMGERTCFSERGRSGPARPCSSTNALTSLPGRQ